MSNTDTSFEPKSVNDYFVGITQNPHPSANQKGVSGNEDPVRKYVVEQAKMIPGVEVVFYKEAATEPGERVIVLRRPGSGEYAQKKPVILQAHLDMVYNPVDMQFPLNIITNEAYKDGKWIKAKDQTGRDSTLGADDGIGVATALAILKDESLKDLPIECLFTVQEETDMGGAQNCDLNNLEGETLLNLDAEDLKVIIYGSAGGAETDYTSAITRFDLPAGYTSIKAYISGLRGGHSGVDINKGHLNAIKALNQVLTRLNKRINNLDVTGSISSYDMYLYDFERTDIIKANAIPTGAKAMVAVPKDQADSFITDFKKYCEALKQQYQPIESGFTCDAIEINVDAKPLDDKSTDAILCIISQIPSGVISMIPEVPDVVETSSNLYNVEIKTIIETEIKTDLETKTETKIETQTECVAIASSNRSSNDSALSALSEAQSNIGKIFNFNVITGINSYVSWQPDNASHVFNIAKDVYFEQYNEEMKTTVIHAGLECGTLASRFMAEKQVKLDCVSIGPTIKNPHTGNETLQIESEDGKQTVGQFYDCAREIARRLYE
ncbi:MAG: M20/M25/M40 family metallo-hydrolase [Bacillota bacterium]|nr:M20/M25/M40 family metallo-hydrolase [Bacillota bacterium]